MTYQEKQRDDFLTQANKFAINDNLINLALSINKGRQILIENDALELLKKLKTNDTNYKV
jgi:hypothetical protein